MEPSEEGQRKWEGRGGSGLEDLRKEDQEETEGLHSPRPPSILPASASGHPPPPPLSPLSPSYHV